MDHGVMEMVLGFVAGCVITSGVCAILWALMRNERRISKQRGAAMQKIAAECAEIDREIASLALKTLTPEALQSTAAPRLETVAKTLTINMRFFDVYYVKYIESLIAQYRQALPHIAKSEAVFSEKEIADASPTPGENIAQADLAAAPAAFGASPVNFDQTWQYDFSKEKSNTTSADVMERPRIEETPPEPTFEAIKDKEKEQGLAVEALTPKETPTPQEIVQPPVAAPAEPKEKQEQPAAAKPAVEEKKATVQQPEAPESGRAAIVPETKILEKVKDKKLSDVEQEIVSEFDRGRKVKEKATSKAKADAVKEEKPVQAPDDTASVEMLLKPETPADNEEPAIVPSEKILPEEFISGEDLVDKIDTFFGIKD